MLALAALIIGLLGIHRLFLKASLPFKLQAVNHKILVVENFGEQIRIGDQLLAMNATPIFNEAEMEFITDGFEVGQRVTISFLHDGLVKEASLQLVSCYPSHVYPVVSLLIGLAFWGTAVFVLLKKPQEEAPLVLCSVLLLFSVAIMTSPGNYSASPALIAYLVRAASSISYVFGIAAFIHFTLVFPRRKWNRLARIFVIHYSIAVLLTLVLVVSEVFAVADRSIEYARLGHSAGSVLRVFLLVGVLGGLLSLLHSSRASRLESERRRTEWILWGTAVGVAPFLFLQNVPRLLGSQILIPEEFSLAFLIVIPISFAIAVLRYQIFDIEIIVQRSIVYGLLTGLVVGIYFLLIAVGTRLLEGMIGDPREIVPLFAAFGIALLFNPVRHRVQKFVDRAFYRERYDFREAVKSLNNEVKQTVTLSQLGQLLIERIDRLIPVEKVGLIVLQEPGHRMIAVAHRGLDVAAKHIPSLKVEQITTDLTLPVARPEKVELGIPIDSGMAGVFERWGISVAFPLTLLAKQIVGVIVLGDKRSRLRYSPSDIDLLMTVASQVAEAVERIQLQEQLIVGEMEKKRLEELNALKSEFVSSVSHELRTPLTSIQMFAETLRSGKIKSENKRREYLKIIHGESERLTRLINNVLDFAKIERGVKQYNFEPVKLGDLLREVLDSMEYQFGKMKFKVNVRIPKRVPLISADRDGAAEAIINLLSNAMKYSGSNRRIDVRLRSNGKNLTLDVRDYGIGIPQSELGKVFEKFHRVQDGARRPVAGTGLGLALVKHIMDAHGGLVKVQSKEGKGSTFTLVFPIHKNKLPTKRNLE
jgi:signal transduction histidine kinase